MLGFDDVVKAIKDLHPVAQVVALLCATTLTIAFIFGVVVLFGGLKIG